MSVRLVLECGGCDATATSETWRREFHGASGRSYGFGSYHLPVPESVCPPGWVLWDLIGATYCPDCWASICEHDPPDPAEVQP